LEDFLATTRQAATPKTATVTKTIVAAIPLTPQEAAQLIQDHYLCDRIYDALLERGEVSKVSDITQEIGNDRLTFAIVRHGLMHSKRFVSIDRQWDLAGRYLDTQKSTERIIGDILERAGCPLSRITLATEMSIVFGRPSEIYTEILRTTLKNTNTYFETRDGRFGLMRWLPMMGGETWDDILGDNNLRIERIEKMQALVPTLQWEPKTYAASTHAVVEAMKGRPVAHKSLAAIAWKALGKSYNPNQHLMACLASKDLVWLSGGLWLIKAQATKIEIALENRASLLKNEEEEEVAPVASVAPVAISTETNAPVVAAVPEPVAVLAPLEVTEAHLTNMANIVSDRGTAIEASELLALQYEVAPGDASYKNDLVTLEARLRADERFLYVGAGRFREPNSLPLFVYSLPEFLSFPQLEFVSNDGEIMDEEIEDGGFVGTLRNDIALPLAQDAGDDEKAYTGGANSTNNTDTARLVLKAHHKEIGTFPLCQFPDGFLPLENDVPVTEIRVRDAEGVNHDLYVNSKDRLLFGFFGLYEQITADSGGVFELQRTNRPFEFACNILAETDPQIEISAERLAELLDIKEQIDENGTVPTFDITCSILEEHPKGMDFVQLLTQVNVIRRVTRRKLASILSNYHCFVQKAGQSLWKFDERKRNAGTDREKKRFVKR
jgi:hypothetical protein